MAQRGEIGIRAGLVVIGVTTMTPALALVSRAAIEYYGVSVADPMVLALLQHRGMMQLVLGAALVWAAFFPPVRIAAALGAVVTKSTFLVLTLFDAATRPRQPLFSTVFDGACVVLLALLIGYLVLGSRTRRRTVTRQAVA